MSYKRQPNLSIGHFVLMSDVPAPPPVPCYADAVGGLHVLCTFCGLWHTHGDGGANLQVGNLAGHRIAHCEHREGGPRRKHGYVLQLAGPYTPEMRQDAESRARRFWNVHAKGGTR